MGIFDRFKKVKQQVNDSRAVDDAVTTHLSDFVETRQGVEGWVEQPTSFNPASLLLVARDGEWTRRSVPSAEWATKLCDRLKIPAYPAGIVGYPQRMRDWNARQKNK